MKIVLVGAGRMGIAVTEDLVREGHDVYVVDVREERTARAQRLDAYPIVGSGCSLQLYRDNNLTDADMLIALSGMDEVNLLACLLAREVGIPRRIARVQSPALMRELDSISSSVVGVTEFIHPSTVAIDQLRNMVMTPGAVESAEFNHGQIALRALKVTANCNVTGRPLKTLNNELTQHFLIAAVRRGHDLIIPGGEFCILEGDIIYVIMRNEFLENFLVTFKFKRPRSERVFIFGASSIGVELAARLETGDVSNVILLDPDTDRCHQAAQRLPGSSVINGSALDQALLQDLQIERADYFIAVSANDADNLAASLLAKRLGVGGSIMLTTTPEQVDLFRGLPIEAVISPLLLSVGVLLKRLRVGKVVSLFKISGEAGEAIEVEAGEGAPIIGKPLRAQNLPAGMKIASVASSGARAEVANGNTVINPGDRIVLVAKNETIALATTLFAKK